jgi:glutathione peroxidase
VTTLGNFHATTIDGRDQDLAAYLGDVVLVVNTASRCGLTPQYEGLQQLYDDYASKGLTILGFPCDQFGHQEPGTEEEIDAFCQENYGVLFPMFSKIDVNGDDTHPLYRWLKHKRSGALGADIKWNFTKFLIGRDGRVIGRFGPTREPEKLRNQIESALAGGAAGISVDEAATG